MFRTRSVRATKSLPTSTNRTTDRPPFLARLICRSHRRALIRAVEPVLSPRSRHSCSTEPAQRFESHIADSIAPRFRPPACLTSDAVPFFHTPIEECGSSLKRLRQQGGSQRVWCGPATCIAHSCHMVNIHAKPQPPKICRRCHCLPLFTRHGARGSFSSAPSRSDFCFKRDAASSNVAFRRPLFSDCSVDLAARPF